MLKHTFVHIPQMSLQTEQKVWKSGIHTWDDALAKTDALPVSLAKKPAVTSMISQSLDALKKKEYGFFNTLPSNQHWRMYSTLKDNACFLDIETTGLSKNRDQITLIGIHSNDGTKIFMQGKNLEAFKKELQKYSMIVTFNGKCFDVPFIKHQFPDVKIAPFHADLRYIMSDLGMKGGLKLVEKQCGIIRDDDLQEVDGFEAVRLWHRYQRGDNAALETLKKYLTADVEHLRILMDKAASEMKEKYFLQTR